MNLFSLHEPYTKPIWEGGLITDESVLPLYPKSGPCPLTLPLVHPAARIVRVCAADRSCEYESGRDYLLRDGGLFLPEGTRISVLPWEHLHRESTPEKFQCTDGGYLFFGGRNEFHRMQLAVTYEAAENTFDGHYRPVPSDVLSPVRKKLDEHEELKLAFFGDSITFGCNASGLRDNIAPFMPVYPRLAAETLIGRGYHIHYYNPSVGGKATPWAASEAPRVFANFAPDLCVIAFGMNDGSARLPVTDYIANIRSVMGTVREKNPDACFLLVSTTLPNPLAAQFVGLQEDYEAPLAVLADEEGAAFLNMTELHRILLSRKAYYHMTGNNINHPSDFLARVYAQGILAMIGR